MSEKPSQDWDPPERERVWYRSRMDGNLGYLVVRGGKSRIRLHRPNEEIIRVFNEDDWIAEREHRPLTAAQTAQVAYEADAKLCAMLGDYSKRHPWMNLSEEVRIKWIEKGPPAKPPIRRDLFECIMASLQRATQ